MKNLPNMKLIIKGFKFTLNLFITKNPILNVSHTLYFV